MAWRKKERNRNNGFLFPFFFFSSFLSFSNFLIGQNNCRRFVCTNWYVHVCVCVCCVLGFKQKGSC
ncbi:hypothetical protein F4809DRAFT_601322, partial [Biscogniauxia mediterranea]